MGLFDFFKKSPKKPSYKKQKSQKVSVPIVHLPKHMRKTVLTYAIKIGDNPKTIVLHLERDFPTSPFNNKDMVGRIKAVTHALKVTGNGKVIKTPLSERREQANRRDIVYNLNRQRDQHQKGERNSVCLKFAEQRLCVACNREKSPLVQKFLPNYPLRANQVIPDKILEQAHKEWKELTCKENAIICATKQMQQPNYFGINKPKKVIVQPKFDIDAGSPFTNSGQISRTLSTPTVESLPIRKTMSESERVDRRANELFQTMKAEAEAEAKAEAETKANIEATARKVALEKFKRWRDGQ